MTREELEDKLAVLLGGRAAERLVFDQLSTGAADDLAKATEIARSMVMRYGMDDHLGHATYENERQAILVPGQIVEPRRLSETTAHAIDDAVREIVDNAFEHATGLLAACRSLLEEGARRLLEKETLEKEDLEKLRAALKPADGDAAAPLAGR